MYKKLVSNLFRVTSAALIGALLASNLTPYFSILTPKTAYAAASYAVGFTVDKAQAARGEVVSYSLIVTNNGDANLTNIFVYTGEHPANAPYVSASGKAVKGSTTINVPDDWYNDPAGSNFGTLTPGQPFTLTWSVIVANDAPQASTQKVVLGIKSNELPNPQGYNQTFTVAVNNSRNSLCSSLAANKTVGNVGDTVTYTIHICNDGDVTQTNVMVADVLPVELTYKPGTTVLALRGQNISINDAWIGKVGGNNGTSINVGTLNSGEVADVTFQVTINSQATEGQVIKNYGQVKSDQKTEWQQCSVDLTVHVPVVCTGSIGDYVWNDQNGNGIQDASEPAIAGVTVTLKNAGGVVLATTVTDANGIYHFNNLCAATYIVEVSGPSGYTATTVNASGSTTANDSNPSPSTVILTANNSVDNTIDFGFKQNVAAGTPNCSLTKKIRLPNGNEQTSVSNSDHVYVPGEQIVYRLFISNTGNADANPVSISDFLPPYLYWVSGDGGYAAGENKVNFDLGTLKAGESRTLTYNVKVRDDVPSGQVTQQNNAKVTSPASFNNCNASSTLVVGKPGAILAATTLPQTGTIPPSILATLGLVGVGLALRLRKVKVTRNWGK